MEWHGRTGEARLRGTAVVPRPTAGMTCGRAVSNLTVLPMMSLRILLVLPILALPARAADPSAGSTRAPPTSGASLRAPGAPVEAPLAGGRVSALAAALAAGEQDAIYGNATVGVQVVNIRTGEEIYHFGDDAPLAPASVMKIVTAATALRELGPAYRIPTWVLADGDIDSAGLLAGSLYIKGQGDPSMDSARLWRIVSDLKMRGIQEIKGDLVLDASYFEAGASIIPGWSNSEDLANPPAYFPLLGALSVHQNMVTMSVRPGGATGQPAVTQVEVPFPGVVLQNEVKTGSRASRPWIKVERTVDSAGTVATFKLTGNVPVDGAAETFWRPVADPLGQYAAALTKVLQQQGVRVRGRIRPGLTPTAAKLVLRSESDPLGELLAFAQKTSNNFYAEQVLRVVGAEKRGLPGTTAKGIDVVGAYLESLGIGRRDVTLINGSGLSRDMRLRPSNVTAVLLDMSQDPDLGPEFEASLSVAGRDGTLWSRFRDDSMAGRLRGKTGTLAGVSTLAGYVRAADGERYAFTFFANAIPGVPGRARKAHDRLVATLAGTSAAPEPATEADVAQVEGIR
jgi:D-alanyl-D-alanine carboxypeptidase/D-alanyl-D-alanine-endopeptidase (penicillin-binding protein 4)